MAPYLWTLQFTHLFPEHCFVLDDGTGHVVGYVIGAPDVFALAEKYPRYVEEVLRSEQGLKDVPVPKQLEVLEAWNVPGEEEGKMVVNAEAMAQNAYKVEWLVLEGVEGKRELVEGWRAMLHIDILEGYQRQGWGREMVTSFVESVKEVKEEGRWDVGKGIQLGVAGENTKVVGFYEKLLFRVYPGGEKEGNVWMVRDV
jgi:ribosomal protein S18 acetylase RimI-like enzyme